MDDRDGWLTLTDAAAELGISTRTIQRWINSRKLDSRVADGRRYVRVTEPLARGDTDDGRASRRVSHADGDQDNALAVVTGTLGIAERRAVRSERGERRAWTALALVGVVAAAGGIVGAWYVAGARADLEHIDAERVELRDSTATLTAQLQDARERAAELSGRVVASEAAEARLRDDLETLRHSYLTLSERILVDRGASVVDVVGPPYDDTLTDMTDTTPDGPLVLIGP